MKRKLATVITDALVRDFNHYTSEDMPKISEKEKQTIEVYLVSEDYDKLEEFILHKWEKIDSFESDKYFE